MSDATVLLGGRYRLDRLIAHGATASVWEGTDEVLARPVAVKVVAAEQLAERDLAAARLAHPNIVAIYDVRVEGDEGYVVMELVRGNDVRGLLAEHDGRLSPRRAVTIAAQVADALQFAHENGVVHGDLEPGNVLCDGDRAKVGGFGIDRSATIADDVHALGILLYEMVCGRAPFDDGTHEPLRPRQVTAGITRGLEDVILTAIARDPATRFATAADLRAALLDLDLHDDAVPLVADDRTPPGGITPSFRQTERSWLVPALAIVLVATALIVTGVLFAGTDVGRDLLRGRSRAGGTTPPQPLTIASVRAFDPPPGDGDEHGDEAALVTDGDPGTTWSTSHYRRADFGGLKTGVGLVLELDRPATINRLEVASPTRGWQAQVFVAPAATSSLTGWQRPVANLAGDKELVAVDLPPNTTGGAVLFWLTSLPRDGGDYAASIGELRVLGHPNP